jgi:hypothetical protein
LLHKRRKIRAKISSITSPTGSFSAFEKQREIPNQNPTYYVVSSDLSDFSQSLNSRYSSMSSAVADISQSLNSYINSAVSDISQSQN